MKSTTEYEMLNKNQTISEKDPFTIERYRQFYSYFPQGAKTILDVGCNTGRGGTILKSLNSDIHLVGLDCVKDRLERLPTNIYNELIHGLSTSIDAENNYFDVICAGEFIEHLEIPDVMQTLNEFYRVLRPDGVLLMTTPNPAYLRLYMSGKSVIGGAHLSQFKYKELSIILSSIGFSIIKVKGSGKVTRILGENFPFLCFYGSYLICAAKIPKCLGTI